jgi:hypothetical protein
MIFAARNIDRSSLLSLITVKDSSEAQKLAMMKTSSNGSY